MLIRQEIQEYYGRFGFRLAADFGIENTGNPDQQHVMACEPYSVR